MRSIDNYLIVLIALCICLQGCRSDLPDITGSTMGTSYTVIIPKLGDADRAAHISNDIETLLQRVNNAMSTYQPDSSISQFNDTTSVEWFSVPTMFSTVARAALDTAKESGGAFDPTVGPLVRRWGFGAADQLIPPPLAEITKLLKVTGFDKLEVRKDPPAIRKLDAELQLDLSAIAKGYAVDEIATLIERQGFSNYLVEIGGELRVRGKNRRGKTWRVGIEQPGGEAGIVARRSLVLDRGGIATSGDYRNFIDSDNKRYSHIINPRSGYPVEHTLASVTVVATDAMQADAWATALMVLGPESGLKLANQQQIAAYFIERVASGFKGLSSEQFKLLRVADH